MRKELHRDARGKPQDRRQMMRFVLRGLTLALVAPSFNAAAQRTERVYRVGVLGFAARHAGAPFVNALEDGLRERGYAPGKNLLIDYRTAEGSLDRLPELAAALVRAKVDVIVAATNRPIDAAKRATSAIPIVMASAIDPVGNEFVASLARPGGNVTGLASDVTAEARAKSLQYLKEMRPSLSRVAFLRDPAFAAAADKTATAMASALRLSLEMIDLRTPDDIEPALAALKKSKIEAVVMWSSAPLTPAIRRFPQEALRLSVATASTSPVFAEDGGLIQYGTDGFDLFRRAATYVDKILKGAKPADLPVEQPTKWELVINRTSAKALGLTIPPSLLARADRVLD